MTERALLLILDGFGEREPVDDNAIHLAGMPNYKKWREQGVFNQLHTSGSDVGLPDGQMGNSEVGHLNIGAGRVVKQTLVRITDAINGGSLQQHPMLKEMAQRLDSSAFLHLIGLVSDGGVHSAMLHLKAAVLAAKNLGVRRIAFHALTDGRDTPADSALEFLDDLNSVLVDGAFMASLGGRYFAMDRDKRWDRIHKAWSVIVEGKGAPATSYHEAVEQAYAQGQTDEFIEPITLVPTPINDGDAVWFLNFRADRVRQFAAALTLPHEEGCFQREIPKLSSCLSMVKYRQDLDLDVLFESVIPESTIGQVISERGLSQLRIAETEKYAHVTYFFNGGSEAVFPGEDRVLIDSPRDVATYDEKPEMSAPEVTDHLVRALQSQKYDFVVCNYANPDMVGHTGNLEAAVQALDAVDECFGRVLPVAIDNGYGVLVCADHGNVEQMRTADGKPHTQHTTGPVPIILIGMEAERVKAGSLCDLAPTILDYMGVVQPTQMTGKSLLERA